MIEGKVVIDSRTKRLVKRLKGNEIAIIDHKDLDQVSCKSLVKSRVKAVININKSISGKYPNKGPEILLAAGIMVMDDCDKQILNYIEEGNVIKIESNSIKYKGNIIAKGTILTEELISKKLKQSKKNFNRELEKFINNTLEYAREEKEIIINLDIPNISIDFSGRYALIVVRGRNYRNDLQVVESYIKEMNPVIIAVDGGADACLDMGYKPDIIIGDMDSVSDKGLKCGSKLIVHAYPDGEAPGMKRIKDLNLEATKLPAPGMSEDIALLLAYEKGAELITAVGTHTNMIDFLEKDRPGMASTMLVRLKIGSRLVDAKGLSKLYENRIYHYYWLEILFAILLPLSVLGIFSPSLKNFLQLIVYKINLFIHF